MRTRNGILAVTLALGLVATVGCAAPVPNSKNDLALRDDEQRSSKGGSSEEADMGDSEGSGLDEEPRGPEGKPQPADEPDGGVDPEGEPPPPAPTACSTSATCNGATRLNAIAGDGPPVMFTKSGYGTKFYVIRVTEQDGTYFGRSMRLAVTMSSGTSSAYDVMVHYGAQCSTPAGQAVGSETSTAVSWGEKAVPNGIDDTRDVVIEVRQVDRCGSNEPWTITVKGG